MMHEILVPVLIVAGLGLLAGFILAAAAIVMAVPKDEKAERINEILPGANCGACGFSGCSGYAEALAAGQAKSGLCSPGGKETAKKIAEILGIGDTPVAYKTAIVKCAGIRGNTSDKMKYQGLSSCLAATQLFEGIGACQYGCIGLGDCQKTCPYDAIAICSGVAIVDPRKCMGCSACVSTCPKKIIQLVPVQEQAVVRCSNYDKGAKTRKICKVGCIGCKRCEKVCKSDAIKVQNFLAIVDPLKCNGCGACVENCSQYCIKFEKNLYK